MASSVVTCLGSPPLVIFTGANNSLSILSTMPIDRGDDRPPGLPLWPFFHWAGDRWFFVQVYRWFPSILQVLTIIRPETLVRWHRAGFRRYWRWKSQRRGGRPQIDAELRGLIRQMSMENLLWVRRVSMANC